MQFTSRDVAQVEPTWKQFVPSATLEDVDPHRFRFDWRSMDLGATTVLRYDLAAQVHARTQPDDQLLVCRVDSPDAQVWSHRQPLDAGVPWLTDGTQVDATWEHGARVRALVFDRSAAQATMRQVTGDDRVELKATGLSPHSRADADRWGAMFTYLESTLVEGEPVDPLVGKEFERHALMLTMTSFSTTFSDALRRPSQRSGAPASVRRALAYIDDNAHLPITIDDVAAAAYMSTRGLQYAFRRALDITPTEALRRARLDGAHRDLLARNGASVATIARRWGFSNSSRFAAAYREAYSMPPTLPRT
ncbi:helix-turn-helix transcriptional regulator [Microbacterium sp. NPDC060132]|uniref:helix-turn-helix transcriptional regulator n=1 Tax=unclassified Microbacterium TaxID=2609290 RepID=UPI00365CE87D